MTLMSCWFIFLKPAALQQFSVQLQLLCTACFKDCSMQGADSCSTVQDLSRTCNRPRVLSPVMRLVPIIQPRRQQRLE